MSTIKYFKASQFVPTKWESAEQKAKFANQFARFVVSGFNPRLFPKWFYVRLSMTFGHIAHYNQHGFFNTFFTSTDGILDFVRTTLQYPCYGDPTYTYSDVEREIQKWWRCKVSLVTLLRTAATTEEVREAFANSHE